MNNQKSLDIICIGRVAVDLYGEQIGSHLEDVSSFKKSLGGSSGNIAFGTARLGLRSSMLSRVGNEQMGQFLLNELENVGCDTSNIVIDRKRLTALALLSIKDNETFPLLFYRNDCADMALTADDIKEDHISDSKSILITGTHLSTESTKKACLKAIRYAKDNGVLVILDIDYRPVLWGLTDLGDGETRFVSDDNVTDHLMSIIKDCDLVVGTEEEIHIAGGSTNTIESLNRIRKDSKATIVLKRGELGCSIFDAEIPQELDDGFTAIGNTVDVLNVLGAGDAFLSGFLAGWLKGKDYKTCCEMANACGALVVSRHSCAPAIPTIEELDSYMSRSSAIKRIDQDDEINYLHRTTTKKSCNITNLCILAFDHRKQFVELASSLNTPLEKITELKTLLMQAARETYGDLNYRFTPGVLIDDTFGQNELNEITGKNWWIGRPVEIPSSRPIEFEGNESIGSRLISWPTDHIVKCLVFMHPDDEPALRLQQEKKILELYESCLISGHELLLEIIPPDNMPQNQYTVFKLLKRIYNIGIKPDWWKLPAPSRDAWHKITQLISSSAPECNGVIILGLDAPLDNLIEQFSDSAGIELCKGFAIGRSIFGKASGDWLNDQITDREFIDSIKKNYQKLILAWEARCHQENSIEND